VLLKAQLLIVPWQFSSHPVNPEVEQELALSLYNRDHPSCRITHVEEARNETNAKNDRAIGLAMIQCNQPIFELNIQIHNASISAMRNLIVAGQEKRNQDSTLDLN
jgi:hypothetical protein